MEPVEPNFNTKVRIVSAFNDEYPGPVKRINAELGVSDVEILYKISQNYDLYCAYKDACDTKYSSLAGALLSSGGKKIVICFMELGLYAVCGTTEEYHRLCKSLDCGRAVWESKEENVGKRMDMTLHQLVLLDQPQKLVFASSRNFVDLIRKYVKKHLNSETTVCHTNGQCEITTTNIVTANFAESQIVYEKLHEFINLSNVAAAKSITPIQVRSDRELRYTASSVETTIGVKDLVDVEKILRYLPPGCTVNIIGQVTNLVTGNHCRIRYDQSQTLDNHTYSQQLANKEATAKIWVKKNPPERKELVKTYYQRYASANPVRVTSGELSKIVVDAGYRMPHGGARHWVPIS
jgi:hypothetical protein